MKIFNKIICFIGAHYPINNGSFEMSVDFGKGVMTKIHNKWECEKCRKKWWSEKKNSLIKWYYKFEQNLLNLKPDQFVSKEKANCYFIIKK